MKCTLPVIALAAIGLGAAQPAWAQVRGGIKITDPNVLQSMGFARNADNVYMDEGMGLGLAIVSGEEDDVIARATPTTGTDFSAISTKEFIRRVDATGTNWRYAGGPNCCTDLSRAGTEAFADAQFDVPTGATLDFFRTWAFDNHGSNLAFFLFEVCQPRFSAGPPVVTTLASFSTSGTPGNTTNLASLNRPVDNQSCTYLARVRFDAATPNLALQKVRLQFTR